MPRWPGRDELEARLRLMHAARVPVVRQAAVLGITPVAVTRNRRKYGLPPWTAAGDKARAARLGWVKRKLTA